MSGTALKSQREALREADLAMASASYPTDEASRRGRYRAKPPRRMMCGDASGRVICRDLHNLYISTLQAH